MLFSSRSSPKKEASSEEGGWDLDISDRKSQVEEDEEVLGDKRNNASTATRFLSVYMVYYVSISLCCCNTSLLPMLS